MKKIFHITDHLPDYHPIWGGAEKVAYRQINLSSGLENFKIFVGATKPYKKIQENFKFFRIWSVEDFFPKKLHFLVTGVKNHILPFDIISFFQLLFLFLKIRPEIIHLHKANKISFTPIFVGWILRIPVVLAIYDYWYFCPGGMLINKERSLCRKFHGSWCKDCTAVTDFRILLPVIGPIRRKLFNYFLNKLTLLPCCQNPWKYF